MKVIYKVTYPNGARVVAQSRQLISVEAEFRNPAGNLLAKATAQQVLVEIPKQPG